MISKRLYVADGSTSRFLSDFIIRSVQFARPYVYVYDNTLPVDGTGDVLQDITKPWSYPDNLYKRGVDTPTSVDLVTVDKWNVVDNSILFYTDPLAGTSVWVEVASSVEEFGNTLTAPSVERAETAVTNAKTSETNSKTSETNSKTSETNSKTSETNSKTSEINSKTSEINAATSAANALVSENNAKTSETNSASSAGSAALSESSASTSAGNAATSETNTLAYLTDFKGRYFQGLASDPSVDLNGDALTDGDLYFNTTTKAFRAYDLATTSWVEAPVNVYSKAEVAGAIGNINSPLLDLPLQNSLAMKAGVGSVTFSRSTTATYIDRYGMLQYAAVDEPRFEKDGLLIEGASTNLNKNSSDLSSSEWGYEGTKTSGQLAPDGSNNAVKFSGTSVQDVTQVSYDSGGDLSSRIFTQSFWVKGDTNGKLTIQIRNNEGTKVTAAYEQVEVTTEWTRVEVTCNNTLPATTSDNSLYINIKPNVNITTFYLFAPQLEELPFASSYIPTTDSTVTRGADDVLVSAHNNFTDIEGSLVFELSDISSKLINYVMLFKTASNNAIYLYIQSSGAASAYCPYGSVLAPLNSLNNGGKIAITWKSGEQNFYVDGVLLSSTSNTSIVAKLIDNEIQIGKSGGFERGTKNMKRIAFYDKALTATEVALLGGK